MKLTIKSLILATIAASLVTVASAAPLGKGIGTYKKAATVEEIQKLKTGDQYALVCKKCDSVTVKEVSSAEEVEKLCHDGGATHCESCDEKLTIKHTGPPGKGTTGTKMTIVNAEGKECMVVMPMKK